MDKLEIIFFLAGVMMMTHIVCSWVLRFLVRNYPDLDTELFAVPNKPINPFRFTRMLRIKYSLLWSSSPYGMTQLPITTQTIFFIARVSGAAFPCLMLAFIGMVVFVSISGL